MFGRILMKRKPLVIAGMLLLSAFASLPMLKHVKAVPLRDAAWVGYALRGFDPFYQEYVVAYEEGSTAILHVSVTHDDDTYLNTLLNVSAVGISLNWGDTFNSTQASKTNPVALEWHESRIFTITFEVPSVVDVSNLFMWDYKVFIEHVNATGTPYEPYVYTRAELDMYYFVVYSKDQAKSRKIANTIMGKTPMDWNSTEAGILWRKAQNETSVAENHYRLGDFSNALVHFENALSLINQAFTTEGIRGTSRENAEIMLLEAQVKWYEGWANFFNGLSNMWTLIGIALVLFALGYIIRGIATLRKTQISQ
jgi:hypothetical protein